MRRRVIQIADSTQLVSLPRKWALKYRIKKGDEVDIEEIGNKLIIHTDKHSKLNELTVDISGLTPMLADMLITHCYQKAYDKIKINFDNPDLMLAVQLKMPELMGSEIMEKSKESCEIQILSSQLEWSIERETCPTRRHSREQDHASDHAESERVSTVTSSICCLPQEMCPEQAKTEVEI